VLRPGGTVTRYYTNAWSEDTSTSVTVLGTSDKNGTPAISASSAMAIVGLAGPTDLRITTKKSDVNLSWSALPNASSYNIKRATTSGGPYTTIRTGQTTTSYTDTTTVSGSYYYVVSAIKAGAETLNSAEASIDLGGTGGGSTGGGGGNGNGNGRNK
jgi:cellulose 1,4-beta-cellobiosidase